MPSPNVTTTHKDGKLGASSLRWDRMSAKVGACEGSNDFPINTPKLIRNAVQAKNLMERGPLLDRVIQYFEEFNSDLNQEAAPLVCVRSENDIDAETPSFQKNVDPDTGGKAADPTISGTPTATRSVVLRIVKGGAHETAQYRRSTDGGETFEATETTPASGRAIELAAEVSAKFTDHATAADETFAKDDEWTFEIKGPTSSFAAHETAAKTLKNVDQSQMPFNWIHLSMPVTPTDATEVVKILDDLETNYHLPLFAVLEARPKQQSETTVANYYQRLLDEWEPFYNARVVICASEGRYIAGGIKAAGGFSAVGQTVGEWRNAASMLTAKLAAGAVNVSAGWVEKMRSLTFSEVRHWSEGYRDYMDLLHDAGLTVLRMYDDYQGVYIARDKIKARPNSDFQEVPERRRADKMHRLVYRHSLPFLNADSETESGSGGLEFFQAFISRKIAEEMQKPGQAEISGHTITLDPEGDYASTGILQADLEMQIGQRTKAIKWRTSFARTK